MIFKYSKWNSAFCYCSAGACVCFVGYLITQEAPKLVALISPAAVTTPKVKQQTNESTKKTTTKKVASGGRISDYKPWWEKIGSWFRYTFWGGSFHIPTTSYM